MNFYEIVKEIQKRFNEKAVYHKWNDNYTSYVEVPWDGTSNERLVYIAGYNISVLGETIIKYNLMKTKYSNVLEKGDGYYGFSHRCGCTFEIRDRIFDEKWKIDKSDKDYKKFYLQAVELIKREAEEDDVELGVITQAMVDDRIMEVVPFVKRGGEIIATKEQALQSAYNFACYVS